LAITACGGGGGDGVGSGGFLGESGTPPYKLSIATYGPSGATANTLDADNPLSVEVTLLTDNNRPVSDVSITLSSDVGDVTPPNGSALTDADGIARFTLSFSGTVGAGQLTATYTANEGAVTESVFIEAFQIADSLILSLQTVDPDGEATRFLSANEPMTVIATLSDTAGETLTPVGGEIVTAVSTIGLLSPDTGSTLSDDQGNALFTLNADGISGAGIITVTYSPENAPSLERSTGIEVLSTSATHGLSLQTLSPTGAESNTITSDDPLTAIVTLTAITDDAIISDQIVTLASDIGLVIPSSGTLLTDASGQAEFELAFASTVGAGTVTASFTNNQNTITASKNLEATAAEIDQSLSITLRNSNGDIANTLSEESPLTVQVAITDKQGQTLDIDDATISLSSDIADVFPSGSSSLTNNGVANFELLFNGTVGAGTVTANLITRVATITEAVSLESVANEVYTVSIAPNPSTAIAMISPSQPLDLIVTVRQGIASSSPVADAIVSLSSDIADVSPQNGRSLTDSSGRAAFTLSYNGSDGAGTAVATFTTDSGNTFSNSIAFTSERAQSSYTIDIIQPSGSTFSNETPLTVDVELTADGAPLPNAIITLSSDVGIIEPSSSTSLTNSTGRASFNLTGDGSTGAGTLTATYTVNGGSVTDEITVQMLSAAEENNFDRVSLTFVNASPINIALRGTGGGTGLEERSEVTFKLTGPSGNPVTGQAVQFYLSTELGGIELLDTDVLSNGAGEATATIWAGKLPTPVRVIAETEQTPLDATEDLMRVFSDVLSISSGIASQARFTVSAETLNPPDTANIGGINVPVTVLAFDRFGNPVPDGTSVSFVTECGGIGDGAGSPSGACRTSDGRCAVNWISQPTAQRGCSAGRATILAYALGEEDFDDNDSDAYFTVPTGACNAPADGTCDAWDAPSQDNSEPFLDEDENGQQDAPEFFIDSNGDGTWDEETPDGVDVDNIAGITGPNYNGAACADDEDDSNGTYNADYDCFNELLYVYDEVVIVTQPIASEALDFELLDAARAPVTGADPLITTGQVYIFTLWLESGGVENVPAVGTTISVSGQDDCEIQGPSSTTVGNSNAQARWELPFTVVAADNPTGAGSITVDWQTPNGLPAQEIYSCALAPTP
jgi:hypothetical protein